LFKILVTASDYPQLVRNYLKYCSYRRMVDQTGKLDLTNITFFHPTTLLPLFILMQKLDDTSIILPRNPDISNYIEIAKGQQTVQGQKTYVPLTRLTRDPQEKEIVLARILELGKDVEVVAKNPDAFSLIVYELVENIYEHSGFKVAYVLDQKYPRISKLEICFVDDGITIPGSFEKIGLRYEKQEHHKAIHDALNGLSSKKEEGRGTGLTNVSRIVKEGFKGEMFLVSGFGAVYLAGSKEPVYYKLYEATSFSGTLVSIRAPLTAGKINIYNVVR
jgi:anti-sigma regulatory factor (Ser/Thr protein kinase)